jgi:uncharacterized protein
VSNAESFPSEVVEQLGAYVYRLIDPRNGETFYVGKGQGNRVFAHVRDELGRDDSDELSDKLTRIREIRSAGFDVAHVIHRHGMDDKTARVVEAALIDAYPGLANEAPGIDTECGAMHALEIIRRYAAEPAHFEHKALLINVYKSAAQTSLYEATRYAWKIDPEKARQAEVVLATRSGLIVDAFVADEWLEATAENFPDHIDAPKRFGFIGRRAPEEMRQLYIGKSVPSEYRKPGAANPIKYTWTK